MALKTYYPEVEKRKTDWVDTGLAILKYDWDNAYPQRVLELINSSPTAKRCHDERTKYLEGRGFEDTELGKTVVNDRGLTIAKMLRLTAYDMGFSRGFAWHINYNALFKISDVHFVPFENVRLGAAGSDKAGQFALFKDWGRKSGKAVKKDMIDWLQPFNPDPAAVTAEIEAAGGWDLYKGQLYYYNPSVDDYTLAECDSGLADIETDAGLQTFRNRNVAVGFMPAAFLMKRTIREATEELDPDKVALYKQQQTQLDADLMNFQGAKRSSQIMVFEYEDDSEKPEIIAYPIQNNDTLFKTTHEVTVQAIIRAFSVPEDLILSEKGSSLKTGGEKKAAIKDMNDRTMRDRTELSDAFEHIFEFFDAVPAGAVFNIIPVPTEDIENQLGVKAGQFINELLLSALSPNQKINTLITVYGLTPVEADAVVTGDVVLTQ